MLSVVFSLFVWLLKILNERKTLLEELFPIFITSIPNSKNDVLHGFFEEYRIARNRRIRIVCPDARYNFNFTSNNPVEIFVRLIITH